MKWDPGYGWSFHDYINGVNRFREAGYAVLPLAERFNTQVRRAIYLRHDVDFDLDVAFNFGKMENRENIRSSYYFRVHAVGYNLFSVPNIRKVLKLKEMGHEISVHIDHGLSKIIGDEYSWVKMQIEMFQNVFDTTISGFSSHEPARLNGIETADKLKVKLNLTYHAYDDVFTKNMKYISDSTKRWREMPFYEYVNVHEELQVLIHPIWWYEYLAQESF